MKICILTLRMHFNFGYLMQAYALQQTLKRYDHDVYTVNLLNRPVSIIVKFKFFAIQLFQYIIRRNKKIKLFHYWESQEELNIINKNAIIFANENISLTRQINNIRSLKELYSDGFDAFIVGSDQVWRKRNTLRIKSYFLDFIPRTDRTTKRISYAASFGTEKLDYSNIEVNKIRKLIQLFNIVSVREENAVLICKNIFKINAIHVLDPVFLLNKYDYLKLVDIKENIDSKSILFSYILDPTCEINRMISQISYITNLPIKTIMPKYKFSSVGRKYIEDCVYPPIKEWIKSFENAEYIITDSFHGVAFSIIFKKNFFVVLNEKRGVDRIKSLLKIFSIENRIIRSTEGLSVSYIKEKLNYEKIFHTLEIERKKSEIILYNINEL